MASPNTLLHAVLILNLCCACVAEDANELTTDPAASDGTEDAPADTDDPVSEPDTADPFLTALDRVEVASEGSRVEILAHDAEDRLIGTLAFELQGIGAAQFIAEFDDGAALFEIDGETVTVRHSDLPDTVVARRAEVIGLEIDGDSGAQEGRWKCAGMTALTIHNCWNPATALWACGVSSFLAACECLDYLAHKYGWMHDEC